MKRIMFLIFVFLLSACAQPGKVPVPITLDEPFELVVGQQGYLEDGELTIELQSILHDNRCPSQVECYMAGEAQLAINAWLKGLDPTRLELNTNPPLQQEIVSFDAYEIRLAAVNPYPETLHQVIPSRDYIITFVVSLKAE